MKQSEYLALLSKAKGKIINLSFELFRIIDTEESEKDKIEAFQFLCENSVGRNSDESIEISEHFTKEERLELRSSTGIFVDSVIRFALQKAYRNHLAPPDFYKLLWNMVFVNGSLNGEKEHAFALYWILINRYIPYVLMQDKIDVCIEKANDFLETHPLLVHRIKNYVYFPLGKRTTCSALIIQELEALDSIEEKTILLAYALSEIDQSYEDDNDD